MLSNDWKRLNSQFKMKLLPTIVTVSSIACGLTQVLSLAPSDPVCPAECSLGERELLKLVKQGYPDLLNELDDKYTLLPGSDIPISEILSKISDQPSSGMIHLIIY